MTADAIDTAAPPAVSFLPHGPNVAAQSLLRDPTLRAMAAPELARRLSISSSEARRGIASVTGMVSRIAVHGQAALREEPHLSLAIGPFLSLDEAMSRYASHRGPIVVSPSPIYRPDAGRFTEAGDTNVSDQGEPANADQPLPGQDIGPQQQGDGGTGYGNGGGASPEQPPQVLGDQGGGGPGPTPSPLTAPTNGGPAPGPSTTSIPGWVWVLGAAAVVLLLAGRKKQRRS